MLLVWVDCSLSVLMGCVGCWVLWFWVGFLGSVLVWVFWWLLGLLWALSDLGFLWVWFSVGLL